MPQTTPSPSTRLAFFNTNGIRVPACPLHAEADNIRPFLAMRIHLVDSEFFQHFALRLQLVKLPLVLLRGYLFNVTSNENDRCIYYKPLVSKNYGGYSVYYMISLLMFTCSFTNSITWGVAVKRTRPLRLVS